MTKKDVMHKAALFANWVRFQKSWPGKPWFEPKLHGTVGLLKTRCPVRRDFVTPKIEGTGQKGLAFSGALTW